MNSALHQEFDKISMRSPATAFATKSRDDDRVIENRHNRHSRKPRSERFVLAVERVNSHFVRLSPPVIRPGDTIPYFDRADPTS